MALESITKIIASDPYRDYGRATVGMPMIGVTINVTGIKERTKLTVRANEDGFIIAGDDAGLIVG